MKYGETFFDILYLLFAIISGFVILQKAGRTQNKTIRRMGLAALILGLGDAFHLVPRMLNYYISADFTAALGIGKLVTSVTMTIFYVILYYIWCDFYKGGESGKEQGKVTICIWILAAVRVILCLFPQNGWLQNSSDVLWGIIRNVPFVILGAVICHLFFQTREKDHAFRLVWLYILLSFLFYIPVAVGAGIVPMLGMLMLPKTVCYVLMLCAFLVPDPITTT